MVPVFASHRASALVSEARLRGCVAALAVLVASAVSMASAQPAPGRQAPVYPTRFTPAIASRPDVAQALGWLESNLTAHVDEWIRITEIPAQSTHEAARAAYVKAQYEREGLEASIDDIGNVVGRRKGTGGGPTLVFAAHMDTVHPMDTDVRVKRDGNILRAPGVFDDSASVANMLAVIRALNRAKIGTKGDLVFIATVQEELGLRGMSHWLEHNPRGADMVVAIDGGLGPINYGALGIYWTRFTFKAAGSHTNTSRGKPHPARAMADAIRSIYEIRLPEGQGHTIYNVGMVSGGNVFNAIPQEVAFTMDLRSVNPELLDALQADIEARVARAAAAHKVEWSKEEVQKNRAGGTEEMLKDRRAHPLVQTAVDVHRFLGVEVGPNGAVATGSTDANAAVVRGIPAISVGRTVGGDNHTLAEWAEIQPVVTSAKMILLIAVAMAG